MNIKTNFLVSGNAHYNFPMELLFGLLFYDKDNSIEIPQCYPYIGEWGHPLSVCIPEKDYPVPSLFYIVWQSLAEQCWYTFLGELNTSKIISLFNLRDKNSNKQLYNFLIVGMAPYGCLAIWLFGFYKSTIISWEHGEEISGKMRDRLLLINKDKEFTTTSRFVKETNAPNGLPPRDLFDNYMKQFTYRYLPLFEHWDEDEKKWQPYTEEEQEMKPELVYIEEALYDGTHDKLHDGGLFNYHEAGKPKKLAMKWHINNSEYAAYFWLEDIAIRAIFDKFYGIHPDTKTDFIIHIDSERKKYQLALFRYGLQEPKIIPEEAYQLIVFKNKFEHFRSENYDQPRGAWIW